MTELVWHDGGSLAEEFARKIEKYVSDHIVLAFKDYLKPDALCIDNKGIMLILTERYITYRMGTISDLVKREIQDREHAGDDDYAESLEKDLAKALAILRKRRPSLSHIRGAAIRGVGP